MTSDAMRRRSRVDGWIATVVCTRETAVVLGIMKSYLQEMDKYFVIVEGTMLEPCQTVHVRHGAC